MTGQGPIAGVIPILQSPFLQDGAFDADSLAHQVEAAVSAGADGVAFPGFVSEWWKLSDREIGEAAEVIVASVRGRVPVVLNVTAQSGYHAARQAREFRRLGASALMCLPPFAIPTGQDAVLDHLRTVMEAGELPFILQYSPSLTGTRLDARVLAGLRRSCPQFCSVKVDFIPTGPAITELRTVLAGEGLTYLIGFAGLQLSDAIRRGADGLMGGAGHIRHDVTVFRSLADARASADPEQWASADAAFHRLLPLLNLEMQTVATSIALHKYLLHQAGVIRSAHIRPPGNGLDDFQKQDADRAMAALEGDPLFHR